jgi:hypothetical protein
MYYVVVCLLPIRVLDALLKDTPTSWDMGREERATTAREDCHEEEWGQSINQISRATPY